MEPINLTYEHALALLERVVAEAGEGYTYIRRPHQYAPHTRCLYVHEGKPDCGIGRALHAAGVPVEELMRLDDDLLPASWALDRLRGIGILSSAFQASLLYTSFQNKQDEGHPWGEALNHAIYAATRCAV